MDSFKPDKKYLTADLLAGLTFALVNIPQSMAHALLAAVNPVLGLYTLMLATPVGALFTSAVFMNVSTTSALAVAAGDTLITYPTDLRGSVLVTLVLLIGVFQIVVAVLRLGWITRFISYPVFARLGAYKRSARTEDDAKQHDAGAECVGNFNGGRGCSR